MSSYFDKLWVDFIHKEKWSAKPGTLDLSSEPLGFALQQGSLKEKLWTTPLLHCCEGERESVHWACQRAGFSSTRRISIMSSSPKCFHSWPWQCHWLLLLPVTLWCLSQLPLSPSRHRPICLLRKGGEALSLWCRLCLWETPFRSSPSDCYVEIYKTSAILKQCILSGDIHLLLRTMLGFMVLPGLRSVLKFRFCIASKGHQEIQDWATTWGLVVSDSRTTDIIITSWVTIPSTET